MAALQEEVVGEEQCPGVWEEVHKEKGTRAQPEISSSRLICRAVSVSGQGRKPSCGEGLDTLLLPSNGGRFHGERKRRNANTAVTAVPCMQALK